MLRAMSDPAAVVLLDPADAYPQLAALRTAIAGRDWRACRAVLDPEPASMRSMLIRLGGNESNLLTDFFRAARNKDPEDAAAGAILGFHLIDVGWRVRTEKRAKYVSRDQFKAFFAWLRQAEQVLIDTAARHPGDAAVWVARIISARGLSLGLAEGRRRYERLRVADPHNYIGQSQFLQMMCPKWAGTWDQLHAWAREESAAAPGSLAGGLVAEAHIEHWLDLSGAEQTRYLADARVRDELNVAAQLSIWHADFRRDAGWVQAASAFAMAFGLVGDEYGAARSFALLGDLAAKFPWRYLGGDESAKIRAARRRAYAATGGVR
jgi:hypothetical protein